jgi:hypothetical protein
MLFLLVSANAMPIHHDTINNNFGICMFYSFILTLMVFYIISIFTIYITHVQNKSKDNDNYDNGNYDNGNYDYE